MTETQAQWKRFDEKKIRMFSFEGLNLSDLVFTDTKNLHLCSYWCEVDLCCSGGAGSDQSVPSVDTHQREEDQHPEPAAAEHAGRPAASLCIVSSTSLENHDWISPIET